MQIFQECIPHSVGLSGLLMFLNLLANPFRVAHLRIRAIEDIPQPKGEEVSIKKLKKKKKRGATRAGFADPS